MTNLMAAPSGSRPSGGVLIAALGASILSALDLFIVNLALPRISESFPEASAQSMSWVINAYTVAFAAFLAPAGRIADYFGRRRVFVIGMIGFLAGAVLATIAPEVSWLVAARALQGVGASFIVPTSLALLIEASPNSPHQRVVSLWAASGSAAGALGPVLGGLLADADWRLVFALKIPLAVLALVGARSLPPSRAERGQFPDIVGALCLAGLVGAVVMLFVRSSDGGPQEQSYWIVAAVGVIALIVFLYRSVSHPAPALDLRLFRIPSFTGSTLGMLAYYTGFSMMLLACSFWATNVLGWSSAFTGLCFILGPGSAVVSAIAVGRSSIASPWFSAAGGLLFVVAGIIWAANLTTPDASPAAFILGFVLTGIASGMAQTGFLSGGTHALPPNDYAAGTGIINTSRQVGAAIGVALVVLFVGSGHHAADYAAVWFTVICSGALATVMIAPVLLKRGTVSST